MIIQITLEIVIIKLIFVLKTDHYLILFYLLTEFNDHYVNNDLSISKNYNNKYMINTKTQESNHHYQF